MSMLSCNCFLKNILNCKPSCFRSAVGPTRCRPSPLRTVCLSETVRLCNTGRLRSLKGRLIMPNEMISLMYSPDCARTNIDLDFPYCFRPLNLGGLFTCRIPTINTTVRGLIRQNRAPSLTVRRYRPDCVNSFVKNRIIKRTSSGGVGKLTTGITGRVSRRRTIKVGPAANKARAI